MRTERIIWGLIFLFIGGVLLLDNFGIVNFHWSVIWHLWPVVLILLGVNLLFPAEGSAKGGIISVILTIAALVFIGYQGTSEGKHHEINFRYENDWDDDDDDDSNSTKTKVLNAPISAEAKYAVLNIEGGATKYELSDTTLDLFKAEVKEEGGTYSLFKTSNDSTENLNFKMGHRKQFGPHSGAGKAEIKLNSKPLWDLNIEVGAGKVDFDLSSFKVRSIKLNGGAASFDLKLGFPQNITTIDTDTGVSKLNIEIPRSAACEIHTDAGLSSNDFDGFVKKDENTWVTPDFNENATVKFVINISGGLSKAKVERY